MDARALLPSLAYRLAPAAGDLADREAEQILMSVLGCDRSDLYTLPSRELSKSLQERIARIAAARTAGTPLPYVLGKAYFHSVELHVSPDVLIPRPDTEMLVEQVLSTQPDEPRTFLDLGTGSGAVAAALLCQRPSWRAIASDSRMKATRTARCNLGTAAACVCADAFAPFRYGVTFDFIVSNPPYISTKEIDTLDESVRCHEPRAALDGGIDGLAFYRLLAAEAGKYLLSGSHVYCEIGWTQGEAVKHLFETWGWNEVELFHDLAGRPRVISARWADV